LAAPAVLALTLLAVTPALAQFGFLFEFSTSGAGKLAASAGGIAADPEGRVFVADTGAKRIVEYDYNGRFLTAFSRAGSVGFEVHPCPAAARISLCKRDRAVPVRKVAL
jgi:sugar lactone lactonase YvrE